MIFKNGKKPNFEQLPLQDAPMRGIHCSWTVAPAVTQSGGLMLQGSMVPT